MKDLHKWATWRQPKLRVKRKKKLRKTDFRMWKCLDIDSGMVLTPWIWEDKGNFKMTAENYDAYRKYSMSMNWAPWVDRGNPRTPYEFPYAFDDHFLILPVFKTHARVDWYYTDRLRENDNDKYRRAIKKSGLLVNTPSIEQCKIFADQYFGVGVDFYAYVLSCNQANGYPIGVIGIVEKLSGSIRPIRKV